MAHATLPVLSGWRHLYGYLGTPLVSRGELERATELLVACALHASTTGIVALPWLTDDGPVAAALRRAANASGHPPALHHSFSRAVLRRDTIVAGTGGVISSRHRRDLKRLSRRLADALGEPPKLRDVTEQSGAIDAFMAIEGSGWKGAAGTALGTNAQHAAYFRELCDGFRADGRLQLIAFGTPDQWVSCKCNLLAADTVFYFKIAHDESFAHYRPGLQLEMRMLEYFRDEMAEAVIDSCAAERQQAVRAFLAGAPSNRLLRTHRRRRASLDDRTHLRAHPRHGRPWLNSAELTPRRSRFRAGDRVRVENLGGDRVDPRRRGCLDGVPFMPEMTTLCGRAFTVHSSAHKTCDSGDLRSMDAAVHLRGQHCDGAAHAGCQSRCLLFFKDAWLEPADSQDQLPDVPSPDLTNKAARSILLNGRNPARGTYSCQGTELRNATTPLPWWGARQYWDDVRSGNITVSALLRGLPVIAFNKFQDFSRRFLPRWLRIRGGREYPDVAGSLETTPDVRIGIEPGEVVAIRSQAEIRATLDTHGANRGLSLDRDMVLFCGQRRTVRHRVEVRIDEQTGKVVRMNNPCLVLEGVTCQGHYHRFCPHAADAYWREAWLERLPRG